MSSNIYEEPNFALTMRFSKGDDGRERLERVVDIYESADTFTDPRVTPSMHHGGARTRKHRPAVRRNPFKAVALFLGLLCLLLLVGISVLYIFYEAVRLKGKDQSIKFEDQKKNLSYYLEKLSENSYCLLEEEKQMRKQKAEWRKFQCHCYYTSTEKKTWTESREDCKTREADLAIINSPGKQEFVGGLIYGDSWIGLEAVTTKAWNDEWKWVDGSELQYRSWKVGVNVNAKLDSKAHMDVNGTWMHSKNGSKYWICERKIC